MAELKVAPEVALQDFDRMCKARRIETDETDWTEADKRGFAALRGRICGRISKGLVTVDVNGDPTFCFGNPPLKLGKPKGSSLIAMDGKTGNAQIFAALADISGMATSHFANFELPDLRLLEDFFVLFFQR
jgi:hypothetical protein